MNCPLSSGHQQLEKLAADLYQLLLNQQRGLASNKAQKDSLIIKVASACKELMAAVSTSEIPQRESEESAVEQCRRQIQQEMISNASGMCLYAHGLMLCSSDGGSTSSQRAQSRTKLCESVKKAPRYLPAWILLSHLQWERGDVARAIRTINTGLSFVEEEETEEEGDDQAPIMSFAHRVALQQLSMLIRQTGGSGRTKDSSLLQLSLDLASTAVRGDVSDGYSWYALALAQLSSYLQLHTPLQMNEGDGFGTAGRRARQLKQVLASFSQAEGNGCEELGDLFFNRAIIHTYSQNFQLALNDFERAASLDKTLPTGAQIDSLVGLLRKTVALLNSRGGVKEKDWNRIVGLLHQDEIRVSA